MPRLFRRRRRPRLGVAGAQGGQRPCRLDRPTQRHAGTEPDALKPHLIHQPTQQPQNLVETFVDVVPSCEGGGLLYTITTTSDLVEHTTTFDDGRIHATFTQTGTFVAVPLQDPSLPSYTGKFTVWGGFNQNGKTVNGTFTFNIGGTGSDGSTFRNHVTDHFNQRPDGTVNAFFHCR